FALFTLFLEGISLEAKKYILAQNPADPGVLILSHFAGASEQLSVALLVNPYDASELCDALHSALSMPLAERKRRHQQLRQQVCHYNHHWWANAFLSALNDDRAQPLGRLLSSPLRLFTAPGRY
ncbi:MAG TPA: alpha,alpha-trehalose-phosphate synthase, partial [Franconibacter pulveris]|nr:alpha,alpha-trehalose-phosphate synthase [Franconibacter pulveris]